jgi:hypothetical protein
MLADRSHRLDSNFNFRVADRTHVPAGVANVGIFRNNRNLSVQATRTSSEGRADASPLENQQRNDEI